MQEILLNNLRITFNEVNSDKRDTLLFIHGNSHADDSFSFQATSKELKDYRLIFINLPGHGGSENASAYSLPLFASIISEFIKELKIENFMLVGHSLGGHVALQSLTSLQPSGLFLFGTPPLTKPLDFSGFLPNEKARALGMENCTDLDVEDFINELGYTGAEKIRAEKNFRKTDPVIRPGILQSVGGGNYSDESTLINQYAGKLMVLLSHNENLVNNNYVQQIFAQSNPGTEFTFIDAGHVPQVEKHLTFNEILADFCRKVFSSEENLLLNKSNNQQQGQLESALN